jgi:pimeloyl-ACP methyl ester carboxylesterase
MPTALSLLGLYVGGAAIYGWWAAGALAEGASVPSLATLGMAILLAVPFTVAAVSFALAWRYRTPRPPGRSIGPAAALRLYLGEVFAIARSHPRMAIGWWWMRDPAPRPAPHPALLIHGVLCNAGMWRGAIARLTAAGCGPIYTITLEPPQASIEVFAEQLAAKVDAILAATGAAKVALVGHSMGGLVARAYLRRHGGATVRCLITIGTPHHGSVHAWLFPGACLSEMRPGSAWLEAMNAREGERPPVRTVALWSWHDSMVAPQASARLAGVENLELVAIGHNALVDHPDVVAGIVAELRRAEGESEAEPGSRRVCLDFSRGDRHE